MRLNRRHLLAGLAGLTWARPALAIEQTRFPVEIAGRPIRSFEPRSPDRRRFGALQFRGGLVLSCHHPRFGGFSALWRSADGRDLVSLTDRGYWLTAKVASQDGRPAGLEEAEMAAMLDAAGRPLARSKSFDTESLAIAGGHAYVGVERTHEILRFDWGRDGVEARARSLPVPAALKKLPRNRGLEALGIVPTGRTRAPSSRSPNARAGKTSRRWARSSGMARAMGRRPSSRSRGPAATTSPISPSSPAATCCCWNAGTGRCAVRGCGSGGCPWRS